MMIVMLLRHGGSSARGSIVYMIKRMRRMAIAVAVAVGIAVAVGMVALSCVRF